MYVDSWFVKGFSLEDIGEVCQLTCLRMGKAQIKYWWFIYLRSGPYRPWHLTTKILLQMVGGFGLRLFNLYVTNGMAYLTHRETTDAPSLDSLYKVGRDAHGNKACASIVVEYCCLSPRWYRKKWDMETQLRRVHGIDIVLPRGIWIERRVLRGNASIAMSTRDHSKDSWTPKSSTWKSTIIHPEVEG